jgi:fatty acid desaturase
MLAKSLIKDPLGLQYYGAATGWALLAWLVGFAGLFAENPGINVVATLLLAHGMIVAAYLVHECAHNLVFHKARHNARLGNLMSWLCGASYGTFDDIRYKHFRHHVDNDDVVWFDYDAFFERHPFVTRLTRALEWLYIPAHDLLMHGVMVLTSFVIPRRRGQRLRNVTVIAVRGGLFLALAVIAPRAALFYVIARLLMIHVLRFMDSVQHDYGYTTTLFEAAPSPHRGDSAWEQRHTFSNPLSLKYPRLNWLVLNFGYHNAHHANMNLPFFRLPALHRELTRDDPARVIPFAAQLSLYHRNRVRRVHAAQPVDYPQGEAYLGAARSGRAAVGGNAASFLTSF